MSSFVLKHISPGQLQLTGDVGFSCADTLRCQGRDIFLGQPPCPYWYLDVSHLGKIDSALLAAFLDWARLLKAQSGRLICQQVPESLARLIALYGLDSVLL